MIQSILTVTQIVPSARKINNYICHKKSPRECNMSIDGFQRNMSFCLSLKNIFSVVGILLHNK